MSWPSYPCSVSLRTYSTRLINFSSLKVPTNWLNLSLVRVWKEGIFFEVYEKTVWKYAFFLGLITFILCHYAGKVVSGFRVRNDTGKHVWTLLGKKNPLLPEMFYEVDDPSVTIKKGDILVSLLQIWQIILNNILLATRWSFY